MTARGLVTAAALAAALGACGSPDRVGDTEEAVAEVLAQRLEVDEVVVTCPDDADLDEGSTVECDVAVGDAAAQAVALEIREAGNARLASAVIPTVAAEDYLASELAGPAESDVQVSCGDEPLLVGAVGDSFRCRAERVSDGVTFAVTVELTALDGTVRYRVEASTTSTTTTTTAVP